MFTIRRVVYALVIVLLHSVTQVGALIMLFGTLIMPVYALVEFQWKSRLINSQHIFNEIITYLVCLYMLLFTNLVDFNKRVALGYSLLAFFTMFLVFNVVIMITTLFRTIKLNILRCITKEHKKKIRKATDKIIE